ncbi:MAG: ABC transporter ATP-binding protein [Bacillota bacterium]
MEQINLQLMPGQILAITGPSGCGKTTLLHLIAGVLPPSAGTITNQFRRASYVFQEPRLLPWRNTLDNVAYGLKAQGIPAARRRQIALELAERLGLEGAATKFPHQLSGGMRQRVALGRALAVEPDLLLMDEPFGALDIRLRTELQNLVLELLSERGLAALLVTHDLTEAVRMGNQLLLLAGSPGRVLLQEPLERKPNRQPDQHVQDQVASLLLRAEMVRLGRAESR